MKWPIPPRVRTPLIAATLGALTLGAAIGWVEHRKSDEQLELDARMARQVAWHLRQADICRAAEASGLPYPRPERLQLFNSNVTIFGTSKHVLSDWPAEARLHDDWGTAMQDGVGEFYVKEPESLLRTILEFIN